MSDIVISRIVEMRRNVFRGLVRVGELPQEYEAFKIDLASSRCEKKNPIVAVFTGFDFDCHPLPVDGSEAGSFPVQPPPGPLTFTIPIAERLLGRTIICKLTLRERTEEDDDNCIILTYRFAAWAQSAANPTPIVDIDAGLDAKSLLLGAAKAVAAGGTVPTREAFILVKVCCVDSDDDQPATVNEDSLAPGVELDDDEGMVTDLPDFAADEDCRIRSTILNHPIR
ncbi:MAG TPA: hypothetical protein VGC11_13190 [Acidimicrobiia bacterium]|jgi:hypothetical protein